MLIAPIMCLGGSVPVFDEVVISLARMNDVIDLNVEAGTYNRRKIGAHLECP